MLLKFTFLAYFDCDVTPSFYIKFDKNRIFRFWLARRTRRIFEIAAMKSARFDNLGKANAIYFRRNLQNKCSVFWDVRLPTTLLRAVNFDAF